jgi:hypothetical protein
VIPKIMRKEKELERDDDSKKSHPGSEQQARRQRTALLPDAQSKVE